MTVKRRIVPGAQPVLVEFECQTKDCDFVTLSLTEAYRHIRLTDLPSYGGPTHNVEPRGYIVAPVPPSVPKRSGKVDWSGHVPANRTAPPISTVGETVDKPGGNPPNADSAVLRGDDA